LRARRNARGLRAALAKVGESLALLASCATVREITAVIAARDGERDHRSDRIARDRDHRGDH
jgi:hypothetical protein